MRYQTNLMRSILTSKTAQRMIDFVSPVYGNSYVGLWIFQAQGTILDFDCQLAEDLRYETNPATSRLLLDMWEDHYKLERGVGLTVEQRQARLLAKLQARGACNPAKMEAAVSVALGGVDVEVTENVSKNKFRVTVLEEVESLSPAIKVIDRIKPAHLIYDIIVEIRALPTADIKAAVAVTYAEKYALQVAEPEAEEKDVYIEGETLVIKKAGAFVDGETLVLPKDIATVDGETLIFK